MTRAKDISKIITDADLSGTLDVAGTVTTGGLTVNDTIRLDNEDTTISTGDVFGDIEFYDNDGGSASAGVTAKVEAKAVNTYGSSDLNFYTSNSSGGARTAQKVAMTIGGGNDISFYEDTGTTPKLFWDASTERLGIGNSAPTNKLEISATSTDYGMLINNTSTGNPARIVLTNSEGSGYIDQNNNLLRFNQSGSTDVAIDSSGRVGIGQTPTLSIDGSVGITISEDGYMQAQRSGTPTTIFALNRIDSDGTLISFRQAGVQEGTISVSGTTVSYNGGHLSRWSQLTDNTRDSTIVKGTVMTNLDQMAEWTTDGVTEDNEQLNCMAVSSVEGDANVAGVFVNWDNDDDIYTNDMNIAMTGDMVIRIAQGTTVARGDLLMSAGDGTAKPQGDDIVRSKTIAKVTSTNVSHTYDDGTYLVPCVLMAC